MNLSNIALAKNTIFSITLHFSFSCLSILVDRLGPQQIRYLWLHFILHAGYKSFAASLHSPLLRELIIAMKLLCGDQIGVGKDKGDTDRGKYDAIFFQFIYCGFVIFEK